MKLGSYTLQYDVRIILLEITSAPALYVRIPENDILFGRSFGCILFTLLVREG